MVVWAGGQVTPGEMLSHTSMSRSRSASRPWPFSMRSRIFSSQPPPSRQGVHWPHDSRWKKRTMRQAARTMQVVWSMGMTEPEPAMEPTAAMASLASSTSRCSGPSHGEEAPPGMNALSSLSSRMPAAQAGVVDQVPEA